MISPVFKSIASNTADDTTFVQEHAVEKEYTHSSLLALIAIYTSARSSTVDRVAHFISTFSRLLPLGNYVAPEI